MAADAKADKNEAKPFDRLMDLAESAYSDAYVGGARVTSPHGFRAAIKAVVDALTADSGWRSDMENAPSQPVIIFDPRFAAPCIGRFSNKWAEWQTIPGYWRREPTRWMAIPTPPVEGA